MPILCPCETFCVRSIQFSPLAAAGLRGGTGGSSHQAALTCPAPGAPGSRWSHLHKWDWVLWWICQLTGKPTNVLGIHCESPAPSHLNLQSRLTKLSIWLLFIWLQNLGELGGKISNFTEVKKFYKAPAFFFYGQIGKNIYFWCDTEF